ncbi:MAG TPA: toll/interleukin-1 receptor domain-containing protein [Pyrinomonadaceae bacterium]|jgi:hypothetical protein
MIEAPKVFISYSHDSPTHKQWVADLATRLREAGVDVQLDQWDLRYGHDVTRFMEDGLAKSSRVLVVCTDNYIRKADEGESSGVGYERLIITSELVIDLGTDKFIPIVRNVSGKRKAPRFLVTRLSIDFSNDADFEKNYEELLRELHGTPALIKPPLGPNPFEPAVGTSEPVLEQPPQNNVTPENSAENPPVLLGSQAGEQSSLPVTADRIDLFDRLKFRYENGLKYYEMGDFKDALRNFEVVKKDTPDYKDIDDLIKKSINKNRIKKIKIWASPLIVTIASAALVTFVFGFLPVYFNIENKGLTQLFIFLMSPIFFSIINGKFLFKLDIKGTEISDGAGCFLIAFLPPAILITAQSLAFVSFPEYSFVGRYGVGYFLLLYLYYLILCGWALIPTASYMIDEDRRKNRF